MEALKLEATEDTPRVILDKAKNTFTFEGRSLPEDVNSFFQPILDWFEDYRNTPNNDTIVNFKMDYFNTASSKKILDLLMKLEEINENGNEVKIKWYYQEDDEDMEEAGEEFGEMVDIPIELIKL